jgi:hypothetical protein
MAIEALANRVEAADRREVARDTAHQYALSRADARRDVRVEEARESAALRPTPADRALEAPVRAPQRLVDILA